MQTQDGPDRGNAGGFPSSSWQAIGLVGQARDVYMQCDKLSSSLSVVLVTMMGMVTTKDLQGLNILWVVSVNQKLSFATILISNKMNTFNWLKQVAK
jgi:hypothetical protein